MEEAQAEIRRRSPSLRSVKRVSGGGFGRPFGFSLFLSSASAPVFSTRSIRLTSASGALSPLRKPVFRRLVEDTLSKLAIVPELFA